MNVRYTTIETPDELERAVDLEIAIWGMDDARHAVPANLMIALIHAGAAVHAAYDEASGAMIGFALAFPARAAANQPAGEWGLWSHIAGVMPSVQSQGVGRGLKYAQRAWGLARGYRWMGWTFDPLQRRNAHFNLHILGATAGVYGVNRYGAMLDALNQGMESDRLEAYWPLDDAPRVGEPAMDAPFAVISDAAGAPILHDMRALLDQSPDTIAIETPYDVAALKQGSIDKAKAWQAAHRDVFGLAFAAGYRAIDFVTRAPRAWYVLTKR